MQADPVLSVVSTLLFAAALVTVLAPALWRWARPRRQAAGP